MERFVVGGSGALFHDDFNDVGTAVDLMALTASSERTLIKSMMEKSKPKCTQEKSK